MIRLDFSRGILLLLRRRSLDERDAAPLGASANALWRSNYEQLNISEIYVRRLNLQDHTCAFRRRV